MKRHIKSAWSQPRKMLVFALLFASLGTAYILITQAASTTQTFTGKLTTRQQTQSFDISTAAGQMDATVSVKGKANLTLAVTNQTGAILATKSGAVPLSVSTSVPAGSYKLTISSPVAVTNKGTAFTLKVTYPEADTVSPSVPGALKARAVGSTQVDLSWTASTDNIEVTGYEITRNGVAVGPTAATSFSDTNLSASTPYNYEVKAKDAAGNMSLPATVAVTTPAPAGDTEAPSTPSSILATLVNNNQANIAWSSSTDNVGVVGYDLYVNNELLVGNVTSLGYVHTGLMPDTTYAYFVKAKDAAGNVSYPSSTHNIKTAPATSSDTESPTAPSGVSATVKSPTQVSLSWTASTDNVGVQGYKIYRRPAPTFEGTIATVTANVTNYTDTTLKPNTEYDYYIIAYDAAGNTTYSTRKHVFTSGSANINISSPASGTTVSGNVTVSGTASSLGGQVTKVEVAGSYGNYQLANGTANWTATLDTSKIPDSTTPAVDDPSHPTPISRYIFAKVTDSTGDFKVVTVPVTLKNDTSLPTATLTSPANNSAQHGFYTITGTASDNVGVKEVYLRGGSSGGQVTAEGTTNWTAKVTTKAPYVLDQIVVFDVNGNKSVTPFNIYDSSQANYNGTISGKTYKDMNKSGSFDTGDQAIANQRLYLWTSTKSFGQQLGNTLSDAEGNYKFSGLQDGDYVVSYSTTDWWPLESQWFPISPNIKKGIYSPSQIVALRGTAMADFGFRQITRNPDPNSPGNYLPLATKVAPNGLTGLQYDDVVSVQEILDRTNAGKLIGEEVKKTKVREGNRFGGGYAGMTNGVYTSDGLTGRCIDSNAGSAVWWPYWFGYAEDNDDGVLFHEYGHAWDVYWSCLHQDTGLTEYMRTRGVDLADPRINTNHEWSKAEIFAEDYRQLFSAKPIRESQENRYIPRATEVPGIKDYITTTLKTPR